MKRIASLLTALVLLAGLSFAQQTAVKTPSPNLSFANGTFYAPNFGRWSIPVGAASSASATSLQAAFAVATTRDGIQFAPFNAKLRITVGTGATADTVAVSAVSNCNAASNAYPGQPVTCTLTVGAMTHAHGIGEPITSADNGIIEAWSYAQQTGGGPVFFLVDCGIITLNTGSVTTTSSCYVPNLFYNQGSASRVTTTITSSATGWELGVTGALTAFSGSNTTLTAGTTAFTTQSAPAANLVTSATAADVAAVIITAATGAAGAGAIHTKVWGYIPAQPAY